MTASSPTIFLLLVGVNGSGKTTLSKLIQEGLTVPVHCDNEEHAFNRDYMVQPVDRTPALHRAIAQHCRQVLSALSMRPEPIVLVDRWYDTYVSESGFPLVDVRDLEETLRNTFELTLFVHLVVAPEEMHRRLEWTRAHRPTEWWDPSRGSLHDRAVADISYQQRMQRLGRGTKLHRYVEIDTTSMDFLTAAAMLARSILQPELRRAIATSKGDPAQCYL